MSMSRSDVRRGCTRRIRAVAEVVLRPSARCQSHYRTSTPATTVPRWMWLRSDSTLPAMKDRTPLDRLIGSTEDPSVTSGNPAPAGITWSKREPAEESADRQQHHEDRDHRDGNRLARQAS